MLRGELVGLSAIPPILAGEPSRAPRIEEVHKKKGILHYPSHESDPVVQGDGVDLDLPCAEGKPKPSRMLPVRDYGDVQDSTRGTFLRAAEIQETTDVLERVT